MEGCSASLLQRNPPGNCRPPRALTSVVPVLGQEAAGGGYRGHGSDETRTPPLSGRSLRGKQRVSMGGAAPGGEEQPGPPDTAAAAPRSRRLTCVAQRKQTFRGTTGAALLLPSQYLRPPGPSLYGPRRRAARPGGGVAGREGASLRHAAAQQRAPGFASWSPGYLIPTAISEHFSGVH